MIPLRYTYRTPTTIYSDGNLWLPADSTLIEQAVFHIRSLYSGYSRRNTPGLLTAAHNFGSTRGADEIILISNETQPAYFNQNQINQISSVPLTILNHATWVDDYYGYYYSQTFDAYNRLAQASGGKVVTQMKVDFDNYYYYYNHYNRGVSIQSLYYEAVIEGRSNFTQVDVLPMTSSGYTFNRIDLEETSSDVFIQTGKYQGAPPFTITFNALNHGQYTNQVWTMPVPYYDTLTHKIWAHNYIEQQTYQNMSLADQRKLTDTSMHHRVLWNYTAFLCLEPSDTIVACEGCDPEGFGNDGTVGIEDPKSNINESGISVAPNPFSGSLKITLTLSGVQTGEEVTVNVVNLLGQVVKTLTIVKTDGQDEYLLRKHPYRWAG